MEKYGLYIHWPYCLSKCPYCDFASRPMTGTEDILKSGYQRDIQSAPKGMLTSLYFGGGTPSLMSEAFFDFLMKEILKHWQIAEDAEITLEANPDAITVDKMRFFKDSGVNRLSVGVQSLRPGHLAFLGRRHSVATAWNTVHQASQIFPRVNMDLIYGLPRQSLKSWSQELQKALALDLGHYSLYQLTIEENTVFGRKKVKTCSENQAVRLYEATDEIMDKAGLPAYEVSNYAKPGQESRHNLLYWTGGDFIGIGPAAQGRLKNIATQNERWPMDWLKNKGQQEILTPEQLHIERLIMGLRLRRQEYPVQNLNPDKIKEAVRRGWVIQNSKGIRPTVAGTLMLNQLILLLS
ncbi:MAG: radical SAM family heme chaperone HemW [Alphaproteobacteria bacterium]